MADLTDGGAVQAIADLAKNTELFQIEGRPFAAIPDGITLQDQEHLLPRPLRSKGCTQLDDLDSFLGYVNGLVQKADPNTTARIYVAADFQKGAMKALAVLNDNLPGIAGWRDFTASYTPGQTVEWMRWISADRKQMTQLDFAKWLEDNQGDIVAEEGKPSGGEMLKMALSLEANADLRVKSAIRLQSGSYELVAASREDEAATKRMEVFSTFVIGVAPFLFGVKYRVEARLRYRIKDGTITFWYELVRVDRVLVDAVVGIIEKMREATGLPVLLGQPR